MILRICVVIPTYNNNKTITKVVEDTLAQAPFPVVVVDDGSEIPVQSLLKTDDRVHVIRHEYNRGKGVAIQTAICYCMERGYTHMLTLDGDGQHLTSEIPKLVERAREYPWDLVIGHRNMGQHAGEVPSISKFGRNFSNFWVKYQTDQKISDSQSGLRIYPLFHLQNIKFWTRRFDFEIEVLIRLIWRGVGTQDVPVEVYYPPADERISHFNKLWDNIHITCLNILLVIISLLRAPKKAGITSVAMGLGVFIGCTPFFGFHTLIAAAVAFFFRLNAVFLILGTHISFAPLAPLLAAASIKVGQHLTGNTSVGIKNVSIQWLVGSTVVGTVLGTIIGIATYFVVRRFQKKRMKNNWNGKSRGGRIGNGFLKLILTNFGLKPVVFCFYFVIPYFYLFAPRARRASNQYWKNLRPEMGYWSRQWSVLKHLFKFALTLLDKLARSMNVHPGITGHSTGWENIIEATANGKGLILLSAHAGSWDLAASGLKGKGMAEKFHMVRYDGQQEWVPAQHISVNQEQQPIYKIKQVLDEGKTVGFMADRPLSYHFELVPFHGKLAPFDLAPFRIAAACRAQVIFTFGFNGGQNNYDFYATPAKTYEYKANQDKNLQCYEWLLDFVRTLEFYTKKYPDQWFNFYPFWSAVPMPPNENTASLTRSHLQEELLQPPRGGFVPEHRQVPNVEL